MDSRFNASDKLKMAAQLSDVAVVNSTAALMAHHWGLKYNYTWDHIISRKNIEQFQRIHGSLGLLKIVLLQLKTLFPGFGLKWQVSEGFFCKMVSLWKTIIPYVMGPSTACRVLSC